jgi:hypothetical protein
MKRRDTNKVKWRVPIMNRYGPQAKFGIHARTSAMMFIAMFVWLPSAAIDGQAHAQTIPLELTAAAVALGFTDAGSSVDIEVRSVTGQSPLGRTKLSFNLAGIPSQFNPDADGNPVAGLECNVLGKGQALMSGWLLVDPAERAPGVMRADGSGRLPNHLVERWGPPFPVGPAGPRGGYQGVDDGREGATGLGENAACGSPSYPMDIGKKGEGQDQIHGALEATCFPGHPSVRLTSPIAKSVAGYNSGMGGALNPDPNGFVSDGDGEASATLKTDFDFTTGAQVVPLVWREAPGVPFNPPGFSNLMDEASFMGPFYLRNPAGAPIGPPPNAPGVFGSSVPPFAAQCTNGGIAPAPPPCVFGPGTNTLKTVGSAFKRVFETKAMILHEGPNGEFIPSSVGGIGQIGVANSVKAAFPLSFGRGVIHDIDGPCDNNIFLAGKPPCPTDGFGGGTPGSTPAGPKPPTHPAGSDTVGKPLFDTNGNMVAELPGNARFGLRFQVPDALGRQTLARGRAVGIGVAVHHDCLTHGHVPGNPAQWAVQMKRINGKFVDASDRGPVFAPKSTLGPPVPLEGGVRTKFPAEFTMIMTGALPGITPGQMN